MTGREHHVYAVRSTPRHVASVSGMVGLMFTHHERWSDYLGTNQTSNATRVVKAPPCISSCAAVDIWHPIYFD